ncbi:MAG: LodA/GoxA family CTQ-dependent oxidase, partial [Pseudomonadota bacterium]
QGDNPAYPQTFPPADIQPNVIDTLGELIANKQEDHPRLLVLGGRGHSGSKHTPVISSFVNNDGWFDDISDGPVSAEILFDYEYDAYHGNKKETVKAQGKMQVQVPAWVVVGYPRFVPEMPDMITLDEVLYDLSIRNFQYRPEIFGVAPFDRESNSPQTAEQVAVWATNAGYNPDYYPRFYRDIWPILQRPDMYQYTYDFDNFSGSAPHNTGTGGNLDKHALSQPPTADADPHYEQRQFILKILRQPLQENLYAYASKSEPNPDYKPRLMPMLCGNNPISNTAPDKFLRMTLTQLFFLKQWADGKFINECDEWGEGNPHCSDPWAEPPRSGHQIDRGVLSNMLGGAFCPGGELSWIIMNPAIYSEPYRISHAQYEAGGLSLPAPVAEKDGSSAADIARGMEPGDLTKYIGIPWQADFHECTTQDIDITYDNWNSIEPASTGDPVQQKIAYEIPWWPAHRPIVVYTDKGGQVYWASGVPDNKAGDLRMVDAWHDLGFVVRDDGQSNKPMFYQVERNDDGLGAPVSPGGRLRGRARKHRRNDG